MTLVLIMMTVEIWCILIGIVFLVALAAFSHTFDYKETATIMKCGTDTNVANTNYKLIHFRHATTKQMSVTS